MPGTAPFWNWLINSANMRDMPPNLWTAKICSSKATRTAQSYESRREYPLRTISTCASGGRCRLKECCNTWWWYPATGTPTACRHGRVPQFSRTMSVRT